MSQPIQTKAQAKAAVVRGMLILVVLGITFPIWWFGLKVIIFIWLLCYNMM